jgi:hypothetical protein
MEITLHSVDSGTRGQATWSRPVKPSFWRNPLDAISYWFDEVCVNSTFCQLLCCVAPEDVADIKYESRIRDDLRQQMLYHTSGTGLKGVKSAMSEVYSQVGYDLTTNEESFAELCKDRHTVGEWDAIFAKYGLDPCTYSAPTPTEVKVVPKFAAACVLALKAKFGHIHRTEANRILIQTEYLKMCREGNVRNCDIASHRQHVLNAFFTEEVMERVGLVRTRVPGWLRKLFGSKESDGVPAIC